MRRSMLQLSEGIRLMASRRICRLPYRRADRGGAPFEVQRKRSPAFERQQSLPLLRVVDTPFSFGAHHKSRCSCGSVPSGPDHSSAARRGKVHWRRGAIYSIASLLVCLLQSAKFPLFTRPPKFQYNQSNYPNR